MKMVLRKAGDVGQLRQKQENVEGGLRIFTSGAFQMVDVARHRDLQEQPLLRPQVQKADRNHHLVLHELQDGAAALNVRLLHDTRFTFRCLSSPTKSQRRLIVHQERYDDNNLHFLSLMQHTNM